MPKISIDEIETTAKTALIKHGADDAIARHVARAVAQAESLGNRICGLYYLESYCVQLQSGRVRGEARRGGQEHVRLLLPPSSAAAYTHTNLLV